MSEVEQKESLNNKSVIKSSGRGGARPGAGRPKGKAEPQTIERAAALQAFRERVAKNVDKLFNAQLNLATGERYLMVKKTVYIDKEKKTWHEIVEDPNDIKAYLDGELTNTDTDYYYMSVKPANNMAIDSLLDRTFGKAQQNMKLEGDRDNPVVSILRAYGLEFMDEEKVTEQEEQLEPVEPGESVDTETGEITKDA